jgi:hypothetical protein
MPKEKKPRKQKAKPREEGTGLDTPKSSRKGKRRPKA